jgi:hypothetical protein
MGKKLHPKPKPLNPKLADIRPETTPLPSLLSLLLPSLPLSLTASPFPSHLGHGRQGCHCCCIPKIKRGELLLPMEIHGVVAAGAARAPTPAQIHGVAASHKALVLLAQV